VVAPAEVGDLTAVKLNSGLDHLFVPSCLTGTPPQRYSMIAQPPHPRSLANSGKVWWTAPALMAPCLLVLHAASMP
jgi:hypothetical protein